VAVLLLLAVSPLGCAGQPSASSVPPTHAAGAPDNPTSATTDSGPAPVESGPPMAVIGTENFYADLLTQIGGSRVQATSLLNDPNADPHEFESSPKDAALVADASLIIVNGLGYDDFMQKLIGASTKPDRVVINVQETLGLSDTVNVHIWYDAGTMAKVAAAAETALAKLDPQNAPYFMARERSYLAALQPINYTIAELKAQYAGTPIAFTEDVAGYMTDQIGLVVKTPVGFMKAVEEGTDPAPADVAAERDLFTSKAVRVLLYNSQVVSPTTTQIHDLAALQGIPVVGIAETIAPAFPTYQDWQLAQLDDLGRALGQD